MIGQCQTSCITFTLQAAVFLQDSWLLLKAFIDLVEKLLPNKSRAEGKVFVSYIIIQYVPCDRTGYYRERKKALKVVDFFKSEIADHKRSIDHENPRDFIDSFLTEMKKDGDGRRGFTGRSSLSLKS